MKKLMWIVLAVCLVFAGLVGLGLHLYRPAAQQQALIDASRTVAAGDLVEAAPAEAVVPADPALAGDALAEAPEEDGFQHVDLAALRTLYAPETPYATIGGQELLWKDYCLWLDNTVRSVEFSLEMMRAYGLDASWQQLNSDGQPYTEYVLDSLHHDLRFYAALDRLAQEIGVTVTEADVDAQRESDWLYFLGEGGTDADWQDLLDRNFLSEELYRIKTRASLQADRVTEQLYGANGEKLSQEEIDAYIDELGYLRSNHILFLTVDMETGAALDEETVAAKKAQAEQIAAELQAIEDRDALLARFAELKAELCEDSGKDYYPDGYVFKSGVMEPAFESASMALAPYEVSDPVLSSYGYHVIMRLPFTADTVLDDGTVIGPEAASFALSAKLNEITESLEFQTLPGIVPVNLADYLK